MVKKKLSFAKTNASNGIIEVARVYPGNSSPHSHLRRRTVPLPLTCSHSSLQQEVAELTREIRRMQDALSIVPKLREENAALLKEVAVLREKQNRLVQT